MKKKNAKKALLSSLLALSLCFSMLVGSTFAWFTDSVTSSGNRIMSGSLKVDLLMYKEATGETPAGYVSIAGGVGDIFTEAAVAQDSTATLWEPGKTQTVYLAVENKGNLALKYNILIDVTNGGLADALSFAVVDGAKFGDASTGYAAVSAASSWAQIVSAAGAQTGSVGEAMRAVSSSAATPAFARITAAENGRLAKDGIDYFALSVHMNETAGNEFQGTDVVLDVTVVATQADVESDSFGTDYDAAAAFPITIFSTAPYSASQGAELSYATTSSVYKVAVPAGADLPDGTVVKLSVSNETVSDGELSFDLKVTDEEGNKFDSNSAFSVSVYVGTGLDVTSVIHNGTPLDPSEYAYNSETGTLTFTTAGFSPFIIRYRIPVRAIRLAENEIELISNSDSANRFEFPEPVIIPSNATDKNVVWSSSDPSVATVSPSGVVTAVSNGAAAITAAAADGSGASDSCLVTVTTRLEGISVSPASVTLSGVGEVYSGLSVHPLPEGAELPGEIRWSSSNLEIIEVDVNTGVVTALAPGQADVIAEAGGFSASCAFTVEARSVTGVTLPQEALTLDINAGSMNIEELIPPTVLPASADNKAVTWSSSDPSVAIFTDNYLHLQGTGITVITVTTADGGFTATCTLSVVISPYMMEFGPDQQIINLAAGSTRQLNPYMYPGNATCELNWVSDDTSVATVSPTGLVTAVAAGECRVTVSAVGYDNISAVCSVTVTGSAQPPASDWSLTMEQSEYSIGLGGQVKIAANLTRPAQTDCVVESAYWVIESSQTPLTFADPGQVSIDYYNGANDSNSFSVNLMIDSNMLSAYGSGGVVPVKLYLRIADGVNHYNVEELVAECSVSTPYFPSQSMFEQNGLSLYNCSSLAVGESATAVIQLPPAPGGASPDNDPGLAVPDFGFEWTTDSQYISVAPGADGMSAVVTGLYEGGGNIVVRSTNTNYPMMSTQLYVSVSQGFSISAPTYTDLQIGQSETITLDNPVSATVAQDLGLYWDCGDSGCVSVTPGADGLSAVITGENSGPCTIELKSSKYDVPSYGYLSFNVYVPNQIGIVAQKTNLQAGESTAVTLEGVASSSVAQRLGLYFECEGDDCVTVQQSADLMSAVITGKSPGGSCVLRLKSQAYEWLILPYVDFSVVYQQIQQYPV